MYLLGNNFLSSLSYIFETSLDAWNISCMDSCIRLDMGSVLKIIFFLNSKNGILAFVFISRCFTFLKNGNTLDVLLLYFKGGA